MDAEVRERMLLRLDWIENTAPLLVPNRERLAQVEDKPAIRRDVAAVRRVCGACFLHRHSTSSEYGREPTPFPFGGHSALPCPRARFRVAQRWSTMCGRSSSSHGNTPRRGAVATRGALRRTTPRTGRS